MSEIENYSKEFWHASKRLELHDQRTQDDERLRKIGTEIARATTEVLELQKRGQPALLDRVAELANLRRQLQQQQQQQPQPHQSAHTPTIQTQLQERETGPRTSPPTAAPEHEKRRSARTRRVPAGFEA